MIVTKGSKEADDHWLPLRWGPENADGQWLSLRGAEKGRPLSQLRWQLSQRESQRMANGHPYEVQKNGEECENKIGWRAIDDRPYGGKREKAGDQPKSPYWYGIELDKMELPTVG